MRRGRRAWMRVWKEAIIADKSPSGDYYIIGEAMRLPGPRRMKPTDADGVSLSVRLLL